MLARDYLAQPVGKERYRVINLCNQYGYLSTGYYCSLLAEAREHQVIPSVKHIRDLSRRIWLGVVNVDASKDIAAVAGDAEEFVLWIYFGYTANAELKELARQIFEQAPIPILQVTFARKDDWNLSKLEAGALTDLTEDQNDFANALDSYSHLIWRKARAKKNYRYDMAILIDADEPFPPSNKLALKIHQRRKKNTIFALKPSPARTWVSSPNTTHCLYALLPR